MPYLGYFQLVAAVDKFVFYDDVNFFKKGWINRNHILCDKREYLFSIPLDNASQNRRINEIQVALDDRWLRKFYKTIERSYGKAPNYESTIAFLRELFESENTTIGELAKTSVRKVCEYADISTEFVDSSAQYMNESLAGQDRILDICVKEHATEYINAQNGRSLYDREAFRARQIELRFISPMLSPYQRDQPEFVGGLSVVDAMMFVSRTDLRSLMNEICVQP